MSSSRKVRIPFIPLNYNNTDITPLDKELLVDYDTFDLYIHNNSNFIKVPTDINVQDMVKDNIDSLLDGVDSSGDSLKKLNDLTKPLVDFMNSVNSVDGVTLLDIIHLFRGIGNTNVLDILDTKVDKVSGKGLSENIFTIEHENKLNSIQYGANKYEHPKEIQCGLGSMVLSVNGRTGSVSISKNEVPGLEDVHPYANNYVHPLGKQCTVVFPVRTVHGMAGDVRVTKSHIGLSRVDNQPPATADEMSQTTINRYVTTDTLFALVSRLIRENLR